MQGAGELLSGMNAVAYGGTDGAASVSRVVSEWTKKNKEGGISVIGGFVDGRKLSASEVEILATLPTRPQLLAMIAATVTAPMQQIASQVSELLAGVARAVDAVRESKEKAG
jgi:large subunit ribosomal protein L10